MTRRQKLKTMGVGVGRYIMSQAGDKVPGERSRWGYILPGGREAPESREAMKPKFTSVMNNPSHSQLPLP